MKNFLEFAESSAMKSRESKQHKPQKNDRKVVMNATDHFANGKGSTFHDVQRYLAPQEEKRGTDELKNLMPLLPNTVKQEIPSTIDGTYKINEAARRRSRSKRRISKKRGRSGGKSRARSGKRSRRRSGGRSKKRSARRSRKRSGGRSKSRSGKRRPRSRSSRRRRKGKHAGHVEGDGC